MMDTITLWDGRAVEVRFGRGRSPSLRRIEYREAAPTPGAWRVSPFSEADVAIPDTGKTRAQEALELVGEWLEWETIAERR